MNKMESYSRLLLFISLVLSFGSERAAAEADVTIQLLGYSNPTFGLAGSVFYCAYQSPSIPPPANLRGSLPPAAAAAASGGSSGFARQGEPQQQQQQSAQNQPQQQQQYYRPGQQPNQQQYYPQNAQGYQQQQQYGQQGQQYPQQQQNAPQQQQYYQQQQQQQQQQQPSPQQYQQYQQQQQNPQQQYNNPAYGRGQQTAQQQPQQPQQQRQPQYPQQQQQQNPYLQYQQQQQELAKQQQGQQGQSFREVRQGQQCAAQQREFVTPNWNECRFTFATIFATFGDEPVVITTGLIPISSTNATIDFTQTTWNDKCNWGDCADHTWEKPRTQRFKLKPNIIEIVVSHFGDAVYLSNGMYAPMGQSQAHLVDTITVNVANITPAAASVTHPPVYSLCVNGDRKVSNGGYPLSSLTLTISIRCKLGFYGQHCNLTNCTAANNRDNGSYVCLSSFYPGQRLACGYDEINQQPVNCTLCPYGIADDGATCRSLESIENSESTSIVGYVIGLAVLATLLAIACAVIVIGCLTLRRGQERGSPSSRRPQQQQLDQPARHSGGGGGIAWGRPFLGSKKANKNGNGALGRGAAYEPAPTAEEEPPEVEWEPVRRSPRVPLTPNEQPQQQSAPIYSLPHPPTSRPPPSNSSTPERNGARREAAV